MSELTKLTIVDAIKKLKSKEINAVELTEAHLSAVDQAKDLNAFSEVTYEIARSSAKKAQENYDKGQARKLEGIPIGMKDLFCTEGVTSTACSNILKGYKPEYESTVSGKMWAEGAVMIGKTNMDEFAMGSGNLTSAIGPVKSPLKRADGKALVPGGSSGGSSAAVAANLVMGATGSDTGGSIRQPAAFTGIVGIKPTYGRCSRYGMIAFSSSLDQAGVFARTVEDSALLLETICGYDSKDSTSSKHPVPDFSKLLNSDVKGMRIGIPKEYTMEGIPSEISDLWQKGADALKAMGAEIVEISLPHTKYALPTYYIIAPAEASSNLARYDGVRYGNRVTPENGGIDDMYEATRAAGFGDEVKRRIMIGTYVLSAGYYDAYYTKAQRVRRRILNDFEQAFEKVDAILTPTAPSEPFAIDEKITDPVQMYLNDVFTVPASLAGIPGISVPAGLGKNGLPLGLQVLARHFDEESCFKVGRALEISSK